MNGIKYNKIYIIHFSGLDLFMIQKMAQNKMNKNMMSKVKTHKNRFIYI